MYKGGNMKIDEESKKKRGKTLSRKIKLLTKNKKVYNISIKNK